MDNRVFLTEAGNDKFKSMNHLFGMMDLEQNMDIEKISIKINLCDYRMPESGAVTDPNVLEGLVENLEIKYPNATIFIIESDASGTKVESLFELFGLYKFEEDHNCKLINLSKNEWINKSISGRYFNEIYIPKIYADSDLMINHPKLKTHSLTKITCNLKNMYGCLRDKYKVKYHEFITNVIVDLNAAIKTDLCIVDADICHEGFQGPTYGTPKKCGLLIGGINPVSVDAFSANLAGFNPRYIAHIKACHDAGMGDINYRLVNDVSEFNIKDYHLRFDRVKYLLMNIFRGSL